MEASWEFETRGPKKGALFISGGGNKKDSGVKYYSELCLPEFVELIRRERSKKMPKIVVITTAGPTMNSEKSLEHAAVLTLSELVGENNVTTLFTRSREVANSDEFNVPIDKADGVWMIGGQQGLLANAFLNTKTEKALHALLGRGGVIGGTSAGTQIMSSFMTRGMNKGGKTGSILGDGDHQQGFEFISNSAFDVHVSQRNRLSDLFKLYTVKPGQLTDKNLNPGKLLSIGIDELTLIILKQDQFHVIGEGYVYVFNPREWINGAKPFYHILLPGDRYDIHKRTRLPRR